VLDVLLWLGVALGALARVIRYGDNRSLWNDEAQLALNVLSRSAAELLAPLDFAQSAPIGFLWLVRASVALLGGGEYALRLLPLAASLVLLPVAYSVLRELLPRRDALVALFLLATSEPLVFYASEFKAYSSDVLAVWVVMGVALSAARQLSAGGPLERSRVALLAAVGVLAIACSNAALFACAAAGLGLAHALFAAGRTSLASFAPLFALGAAWAASFGLVYAQQLGAAFDDAYLSEFWRGAYAPFPPLAWEEVLWYPRHALGFLDDPVGLPPAPLALAAVCGGGVVLCVRDRASFAWLVGPIAIAFAACAVELFPLRTAGGFDIRNRIFPFDARLWLFAVPGVLALIAVALAALRRAAGRGGELVLALGLLLVCGVSLRVGAQGLVDPPTVQELRPLLARVAAASLPGDRVWVQRGGEPTFEYYARRLHLALGASNVGAMTEPQRQALRDELARLAAGERVWFVALHHPAWDSRENSKRVEGLLAGRARRAELLQEPGAVAQLWIAD
jgi:hypothetical protein